MLIDFYNMRPLFVEADYIMHHAKIYNLTNSDHCIED